MSQTEAIEAFLADYRAGIPAMNLAWRNATRLQLNQKMLEKLNITQYNDPKYQYLAVNNTELFKNGETFFFNSAKIVAEGEVRLQIKDFASPFKKFDVAAAPPRTLKTQAVFLQDENDVKYVLLPKCSEPTVYGSDIIGNTIPSQLWRTWTDTSVSSKDTYQRLKKNVVVCEPGLVLTVHKAQGSQWQKVYILENALHNTNWFYTACTRAEQEIVVVGGNSTMATKPVQTMATKPVQTTATKSISATEEKTICGSGNTPVGYYTGAKTAEELQGAELVFYTSSFTQPKQEVSVDKRFAGIICQFTEEQIAQYADRVLEVAKTVKEKSDDGDSEFTDMILSFTVEQIRGCVDLIAQAAKQFFA